MFISQSLENVIIGSCRQHDEIVFEGQVWVLVDHYNYFQSGSGMTAWWIMRPGQPSTRKAQSWYSGHVVQRVAGIDQIVL